MLESLDFNAVDVETANADLASICQVGVVSVREGRIQDVWCQLVDPQDYFDFMNVHIHGIDEFKVRGSPTFTQIVQELDDRLAGVVVSHTSFDRVAISRAAERAGHQFASRPWLDSARVVRRAWPDKYARRGYGLADVSADLGIEFSHHNAGEDARAAAEIMLRACQHSAMGIEEWLDRVKRPVGQDTAGPILREGNLEGMLCGEVVVFTGTLTIPRREAADLAASVGCTVASGVTGKTTILVVGDQDIRRLAGQEKSSKHRKAEELVKSGKAIRVLSESDFERLVRDAQ